MEENARLLGKKKMITAHSRALRIVNTTLEPTPLMPFANVVELHQLQEYLAEQQEQEELVAVLEGAAPQVDTLREVRGTLLLELDTLQVE